MLGCKSFACERLLRCIRKCAVAIFCNVYAARSLIFYDFSNHPTAHVEITMFLVSQLNPSFITNAFTHLSLRKSCRQIRHACTISYLVYGIVN